MYNIKKKKTTLTSVAVISQCHRGGCEFQIHVMLWCSSLSHYSCWSGHANQYKLLTIEKKNLLPTLYIIL